jgi:hypothetical protein
MVLGLIKELSHMILTRDRHDGKDFPMNLALVKFDFDMTLADKTLQATVAMTYDDPDPSKPLPPNTEAAIAFGQHFLLQSNLQLLDFALLRLEPPLYRHTLHSWFRESVVLHEMCHCFKLSKLDAANVGNYDHLFTGKVHLLL